MEDLDKILSKSYAELTASEKAEIQDICGSEEEFVHLQQVFASVENYARETLEAPAPATKEKLDDLFYQTYQNKGILWYNSIWMALYPAEKRFDQRPLVRVAALLILLVSVVPFLNRPGKEDKQMLAKLEVKQDEEKAAAPEAKLKMEAAPPVEADKQITASESEEASAVVNELAVMNEGTYMNQTSAATMDVDLDMRAFPQISAKNYAYSNSSRKDGELSYSKLNAADGIYMDTLRIVPVYPVSRNMAMLDVLTPTF